MGANDWLDALVKATTAFPTFDAMEADMLGGYVPTIREDTRRKRLLRRVLDGFGWRVWPAMKGGQ